MEEKNLTTGTEESGLSELLDEVTEEVTEKVEEVKEELTELVEEIKEEVAEATEELAEEVEELAEKVSKKGARRLFLGAGMLEWISTFAFCSFILYAGYLFGQAVQSGATGLGILRVALSDWYGCAYLVMMALFMMALFGVLAGSVAKKKGTLCLLVPTVAYFGLTVYKLIQPVTLLVSVIAGIATGDEQMILRCTQLLVPLTVLIIPYLLQAIVLVSFAVRLFGRGNRWAHMVLCVLWAAFSVINVLMYLQGTFTQCAPQYMLALQCVATGLLLGVTGFAGASVAKAEYAALRDADAAAFAEKNAKKSKKAAAEEETAGEEPCECEESCDCEENVEETPAEEANEESVEEAAEEAAEEVAEEAAEEVAEETPVQE